MEVSCHPYALVAYPWGMELAIPIEWEALLVQKVVWTLCKGDTALTATENRTTVIYVLHITDHAPSHLTGRRRITFCLHHRLRTPHFCRRVLYCDAVESATHIDVSKSHVASFFYVAFFITLGGVKYQM